MANWSETSCLQSKEVKTDRYSDNGVVWRDDCQVVQVYAMKVYGGVPGVSVKVDAAHPLLAVRGEVS